MFFQALQGFSAALASCQLGPLMAQFGLNEDAVQAAVAGGVFFSSSSFVTHFVEDIE